MNPDFKKRSLIKEVLSQKENSKVILAGWLENLNVLGKIAFLKLRDRSGKIQLVVNNTEILKNLREIHPESVVLVKGAVKKSELKSGENEVAVEKLDVLSNAEVPLPIDFSGRIPTAMEKRIDYRFLDLRNKKIQAIFEIQSEICRSFREFFRKNGFTEFWPPGIIAAASEGGTELFEIKYFNRKAYLAQSPQLYKQMLACSNLERVFSINPIWRAEPHNTPRHLNESRQMDIEVAFAGQFEVMEFLEKCVQYIVKNVKENCPEQIKLFNENLKIPKAHYLSYTKVIDLLNKNGLKIEWGEDIPPEGEKKLAELKGKDDLIFIHSWPSELKPFYIMPNSKDGKLSEGFDADFGGLEIASGGQRIHIPNLLIKQLKKKGLNPENFKFYVDSFRYGSPPHAGWSIGLERLTMVITGQKNIRETVLYPRDMNRLTP